MPTTLTCKLGMPRWLDALF